MSKATIEVFEVDAVLRSRLCHVQRAPVPGHVFGFVGPTKLGDGDELLLLVGCSQDFLVLGIKPELRVWLANPGVQQKMMDL